MVLIKFYKSLHSTFTYNISVLYSSAAQELHTIVLFWSENFCSLN